MRGHITGGAKRIPIIRQWNSQFTPNQDNKSKANKQFYDPRVMTQTISVALHRYRCGATSRAKTIKSNSDDKRLGVAACFVPTVNIRTSKTPSVKAFRMKEEREKKTNITESLKKYSNFIVFQHAQCTATSTLCRRLCEEVIELWCCRGTTYGFTWYSFCCGFYRLLWTFIDC